MKSTTQFALSFLAALLMVSCTVGVSTLAEEQQKETFHKELQDTEEVQVEAEAKTETGTAGRAQDPAAKRISDIPMHLAAPEDFFYHGAFRLPDDRERPLTFAYGGEAMTFSPAGDPEGSEDGFGGSLFVMGHNRMPYGELPDGNQVAEITIPQPIVSDNPDALNQAQWIQDFQEVAEGWFQAFEEIPRVGMEYLETRETGPLIHLGWGAHFHDESGRAEPTHAWFSPDLAEPNMTGPWLIGDVSPYSVNNYLFTIPEAWADEHTSGKVLAAGRFRDGGWSGMGPSLYAYRPWADSSGTPAAAGAKLEAVVLLQYAKSTETDRIERCLDGYQHGDEWEGGAWITTGTGKNAVLFAGTKSVGERYWYGFLNPAGSEYPCLQADMIGEYTLCRLADGTPCPDEAQWICNDPVSGRGWWSSEFAAQFILFDPDDLARVAAGDIEPWEPQPYAVIDIDRFLYHNPTGVDEESIGSGDQRRYRIGDVAYDRDRGLLYVLEFFADEARPVVHVWEIR